MTDDNRDEAAPRRAHIVFWCAEHTLPSVFPIALPVIPMLLSVIPSEAEGPIKTTIRASGFHLTSLRAIRRIAQPGL